MKQVKLYPGAQWLGMYVQLLCVPAEPSASLKSFSVVRCMYASVGPVGRNTGVVVDVDVDVDVVVVGGVLLLVPTAIAMMTAAITMDAPMMAAPLRYQGPRGAEVTTEGWSCWFVLGSSGESAAKVFSG